MIAELHSVGHVMVIRNHKVLFIAVLAHKMLMVGVLLMPITGVAYIQSLRFLALMLKLWLDNGNIKLVLASELNLVIILRCLVT
jgi:hypothetical protein